MEATDNFLCLYQNVQEKCLEALNKFEEHFLWLEEVTANARQLFSSTDPTLLPKTPLGKKKSRLKKPHHSSIAEDEVFSSSKRLSTCNTGSNINNQSPLETPPRRGRAASRLAHEKMKRVALNDKKRKLRRPSTPTVVPMTTKKTRGTCQVIFKGDSFESSSSYKEVKGADSGHGENCESHFEEMEYESTVDPCESAVNPLALDTPSKKNDGVKCLSVKVSLERLSHLHTSQEVDSSKDTTQVTVTNAYQEEGVGCISETTCSYSNLRLEDSDDNKSTRIKELDVQRSGNEMCKGKEKEEPLSPNNCTENACTKCENYDECNSQSRTPEEVRILPEQTEKLVQPIPSGRTTRTKQKELQLSTREDITDNMVSTADQPHPVPKPRLTRTKQKEVLPLLNTADESEGQLLPPMDFPKPRMTRTKTKAKEQTNKFENVEYDSQSSVEEGYNTHEKAVAQPSEEIPMSRSTRTKKKVIEVILIDTPVKNDINKSVDNESQKPRTTRTKKRMFDELGVDQPTRSTRTKCKKMEEQPEKESVASEKLGLCLFLTESEDEKDGKSSRVVQKSPLVRSVPSVTSMKPSQSTTSYTSENTVMAATSTQNTEIGPVRRITRSKVRQLPALLLSPCPSSSTVQVVTPGSPVHTSFKRACCTPNSDKDSPMSSTVPQKGTRAMTPVKHSPRTFAGSKTGCTVRELATAYQNHIGETLNEVEELTSEECEVTHSPARVTRHARVRHAKTPDSQRVRINLPARTPPATCPSDKVIRPKKILLSSSSSSSSTHGSSRDTPKTFSRSRLMLSSSSSKFGDPNEAKYPTNIVTGITSFIKIQPAKPSREELEVKRQTGLQKKRDREDETIKKKEELLKLKAEEQKRRNEERMKRVQEAREERERKAIEAKKQQDRDRKNREERLREQQQQHRKQQLLAKKRAEEARVKKIKEQEEERRKQEEESRKLKEEEKQNEEEKLLYLAEQRRRQEEERKRKIAEVERIAREKKELEYLKLLEAQRIAELQQAKLTSSAVKKIALADNKETGLNHTFTLSDNKENGLNATFSKTTGPSQSSSTGKNKDSYDITPNSKKYKKNINNYDINDIKSDDSTDEDSAPKRKIPPWAMRSQLTAAMINQVYSGPVVEEIFPPTILLTTPDLTQIFPKRKKFNKRTSSAIWTTPLSKYFE